MLDAASLIRFVARGQHGAQHLTQAQARQLFSFLLQPDADSLQLGALLIAERMKGESSAELAGFVQAARDHVPHFAQIVAPDRAVDLPCYAGKRRAAHAYLIAALQARDAGVPVVVHGVQDITGRVSAWQVLKSAGIASASSLSQAKAVLDSDGMVYLDLEDICPNLFRVYNLRERLGVRSFANTVARLLNPMRCDKQLNGFFHTPYAAYMAEANVYLSQRQSLIFMGAEGDPELYADRQKVVKNQHGDVIEDVVYDDCGYTPYPKAPVADLQQLFDDFKRMYAGKATAQEQATIQRCLAAFQD